MKVRVRRVLPYPPAAVYAVAADPMRRGEWGPAWRPAGNGFQTRQRIGTHEVVMEVGLAEAVPGRIAWRTRHEALEHEAVLELRPHRRGTLAVQTDRETWRHAPWWARWSGRSAVRRELQRRLALLEQAVAYDLLSNSV